MDDVSRHAEVSQWFARLIEASTDQRDALLQSLQGSDPGIASEVRALMEHYVQDESAFQRLRPRFEPAQSAEAAWRDKRIGAWSLRRLLGEGGMGLVFLAERAGDEFAQQGALKLVRTRFPGQSLLARFRRERRMLATLDHPGITKLLDGGETEEGEPYLVLEYVDGLPIDQYCADRAPTLEQHVALIDQVCSAVAYAHRRLIVHRDLKPGNILVDASGRCRLLDFGIARLLDSVDTPEQPLTGTLDRLLTPAYAAPEQIAGGPITTQSDIYALGVIACQIITGRLPSAATPDAAERTLRASDLARAAGRSELAKRLRGDFDTVLARALHPIAERRYVSAEAFAEDLHRALAHQPIHARPDRWAYRLNRWFRRHWAAAGISLLAVATLIAALGQARWQAERARIEAEQADVALARAQHVNRFLTQILIAPDPGMRLLGWPAGGDTTVAELLRGVAPFIDAELADDPLAAAVVHSAMGQGRLYLGDEQDAVQHLDRAIELSTGIGSDASRRPREQHEAIEVQAVSMQLKGRLAILQQRWGDAERALREAISVYLRAPRVNALRQMSDVATRHDLAYVLHRMGRLDEAETEARGAVARSRGELPAGNPVLPIALDQLARILEDRGEPDQALAVQREALTLLQQQGAPDSQIEAARSRLEDLGAKLR
jgi:serine/threonine-protein kinase